jgi:hypothetical protein
MDDPTPEQRADFLVRKLEQIIREGRSEKGMSFRTWQMMAREELTNSYIENERRVVKSRQDHTAKRLILVSTSTVVTIGFWGTVVSLDHHFGELASWIGTFCGFVLAFVGAELLIRRMSSQYRAEARRRRFERIEDFDKKVKKLENDLWLKLKKAKEQAEKQAASA